MTVQDVIFSLRDKVAIVTGAIGLLGKQHCTALAQAGAHVVVTDVERGPCEEFAAEFTKRSLPKALGCQLDVTSTDSIRRVLAQVMNIYGRLDILINNAAVNDMVENPCVTGEESRFENYPLALWQKSIDVSLTGTFLCSQIFGAVMAEQEVGSIINIASTYGIVAPDQSLYRKPDGSQTFYKPPAYSATKGAIISFTRYLAAYWGSKGVRVNSLSPGGVFNGQEEYFVKNYSRRTPLGRMASQKDYRGAIVFLASDASNYMTGANLVVDGGWCAW